MTRHGIIASCALVAGSCSWELERMNDQPRCEPGEATRWLAGGTCDQPTPEGTIAWRSIADAADEPRPTRATIARGGDRFERFCAPCHGTLGDAESAIARDMVLRSPPSLHEARLVAVTDRRLFEVIGEGYGLMPAYGVVLGAADRWAVVHYVRVLQRSQRVSLRELPPARAQEASRWLP